MFFSPFSCQSWKQKNVQIINESNYFKNTLCSLILYIVFVVVTVNITVSMISYKFFFTDFKAIYIFENRTAGFLLSFEYFNKFYIIK